MVGQPGFFDLSDRYAALSAAGDPLEPLAAIVDFEVFRWQPVAPLRRSARGKGDQPPSPPFDTAVIESNKRLKARVFRGVQLASHMTVRLRQKLPFRPFAHRSLWPT